MVSIYWKTPLVGEVLIKGNDHATVILSPSKNHSVRLALKLYFRGVNNTPCRSPPLQPKADLSGHIFIDEDS
jgi:hypothetical protein